MHEHGVENYEEKMQNFGELGAAPWSVVALHNTYLAQVRAAFTSTHYYPALLGACGLGERVLNQLILTLRDDYADHDATRRVRGKQSFDDWKTCIDTLREWGVFSDSVKRDFAALMRARHAAVHYRSSLDDGDARPEALVAVKLLSGLIEAIFSPMGDRPYYFTGPIGRSYVRRESEADPFVRRFIIPACILVSPFYRFEPVGGGFAVYDDSDYGSQGPDLSDEAFVAASRSGRQVPRPF